MTYIDRVFNRSCETMAEIPDGVVNACVTSPPYFAQRDYGAQGQIGLEATPAEYVERLVAVFREVRRVLRNDGTLWLNLGDSYAGSRCGPKGDDSTGRHVVQSDTFVKSKREGKRWGGGDVRVPGIKPKDLIGAPWMLAFALREDGWYLRCDIVWSKPNPMPESVADRPTRAHEYVFLLSKSARYRYDAAAIAEPAGPFKPCGPESRMDNDRDPQHGTNKQDAIGKGTYTGFNARWRENPTETRNKRSVWDIAPQPYAGSHFAVMPMELVKPCILAGSPADGLVLDPFMGSGTVADVALGCGRHFVGYELNPDYCNLIRERLGLFGEGVA